MTLVKSITLALAVLTLTACSSPEPLDDSHCKAIVKHVTKSLGKLAPEPMGIYKECKAGTDEQRGCVMVAENAMQVSKCF